MAGFADRVCLVQIPLNNPPYQFAGNNPIMAVDIDGLEPDKDPNPTQNHQVSAMISMQECLMQDLVDFIPWIG
jgi:hypothetical protein